MVTKKKRAASLEAALSVHQQPGSLRRAACRRSATTRWWRTTRRRSCFRCRRGSRSRSCHVVDMVMEVTMHHPPVPRSPGHRLLGNRLSAISSRLGIVGRLLSAAGCRLSLRCRRLSTLSSRISARGCLIGLISRVDRILLRSRIARTASSSHQRQDQQRAGQPNQF